MLHGWVDLCREEGKGDPLHPSEACGWAVVVAREAALERPGSVDDQMTQDLLERACNEGFSWPCVELGRRYAPLDMERARDAWRRACAVAPNDFHCGLVDGRWDWRVVADDQSLSSIGAVFEPPQSFSRLDSSGLGIAYVQPGEHGKPDDRLEVRYEPMILSEAQAGQSAAGLLLAWVRQGGGKVVGSPETLPHLTGLLEFGADDVAVAIVSTELAPTGLAMVLKHNDRIILVRALFSSLAVMRGGWPAVLHAARFTSGQSSL